MIKYFCEECGRESKFSSVSIAGKYLITEIRDIDHGARVAHVCEDCLRKLLTDEENKK